MSAEINTKNPPVLVIDISTPQCDTFDVEKMPVISQDDAMEAANTVEEFIEKYQISEEDMDTLFSSMVSVFLRGRYCTQNGYVPDKKGKKS